MLITIRRNTVTGRFHPFVWSPSPLPGPDQSPVLRYKSRAHHTTGLETLEAAQMEAREGIAPKIAATYGPPQLDIDVAEDDAWQEGEVPTSVLFRQAVTS